MKPLEGQLPLPFPEGTVHNEPKRRRQSKPAQHHNGERTPEKPATPKRTYRRYHPDDDTQY